MKRLVQLVVLFSSVCYSHVTYAQANSSVEQEKKKIVLKINHANIINKENVLMKKIAEY